MAIFAFAAFKFYQKSKVLGLSSGSLNYSKWARDNKREARTIVFVFNLAMMICGLMIGLACYQADLRLGEPVIYIGLGIFLLATFLFPKKDKSDPTIAIRYKRKKVLSAVRIGGASIAFMAYANNYLLESDGSLTAEAAVHPAILVILATAGLLIFGYAILALSCGLACAGHEGAAMLLAVGGGAGLIILYIWILRKIFTPNKDKIKKLREQEDTLDEIV